MLDGPWLIQVYATVNSSGILLQDTSMDNIYNLRIYGTSQVTSFCRFMAASACLCLLSSCRLISSVKVG